MYLRMECFLGLVFFLSATLPAHAVILAQFDFETPAINDTIVTNLGVGPDGILVEGATIADGVLNLENVSLNDVMDPHGMELPLGVLNPFGGESDWRVAFDFSSEDGGGALFRRTADSVKMSATTLNKRVP